MTTRNFIIATAGHVDHGKTALVQALTGTDPDRLPEEKARGITIDLGFAELNLTGPNGDLHAAMIDVPGHEDFVRNMVAGVGSIDLALLVVAADDGWMPQTEEHFQILTYLGIERSVIALTKADLGNVERITAEIHAQLRGTADLAIVERVDDDTFQAIGQPDEKMAGEGEPGHVPALSPRGMDVEDPKRHRQTFAAVDHSDQIGVRSDADVATPCYDTGQSPTAAGDDAGYECAVPIVVDCRRRAGRNAVQRLQDSCRR